MKKRPFAFKSQEGLRRSIIQLRCASENNLRRPTADSRSGPVKLPVRKGGNSRQRPAKVYDPVQLPLVASRCNTDKQFWVGKVWFMSFD